MKNSTAILVRSTTSSWGGGTPGGFLPKAHPLRVLGTRSPKNLENEKQVRQQDAYPRERGGVGGS